MRIPLPLFLAFLIAFLGCSKPAGKSKDMQTASSETENIVTTCPEFFYYYNQEKVPMQIHPEVLLVGFAEGQTAEEKQNILSRFAEFDAMGAVQRSAAGVFSIVKLKPGTTCTQALTLTGKLKKLPAILFANPVFKPPHTLGTTYAWVGITSEFIVTLNSEEDRDTFEKVLAQTKTRILDSLGEATFLVQANKTAQGNALEMANYFHEQEFVQNAEPDFFLASPQN